MAPLGRSTLPKDLDWRASLQPRLRADAITLLSPTSEEIGVLDLKTACVLKTLIKDNPLLEFEAFADQDQLRRTSPEKKGMKILPLCINVHGLIVDLDKVASVLSETKVFLQEPIYFHPSSTYHNPHFLDFDHAETPRFLDFSFPLSLDFTAEVDAILAQPGTLRLPAFTGQDQRIQTKLHEYDISYSTSEDHALTPLRALSQQLAALQFMITREDEYDRGGTVSLWETKYRSGKDV